MNDLFSELGLSRDASEAEIKAAFRRLARQYHPDVNPSPEAAERFKQFSEAYHLLTDRKWREFYRGDYGVPSEDFLRREVLRQEVATRLNAAVDQWLRQQREEESVRRMAVRTVVGLFLSTFGVAMARPPVFDMLNLPGCLLLLLLSMLGMWEVVHNLGRSLSAFTYAEESIASLFRSPAPPSQPFPRFWGVGFLVLGYLLSLGSGWIMGEWTGPRDRAIASPGVLFAIVLLPPIAVLIIGRLGGLMERDHSSGLKR
ncbi:MAG: DnaJ domain-containing protein [Acidobacteria bacterium]|nr:DnaJ domain-containing protein [Acidobacteriota bacterium]